MAKLRQRGPYWELAWSGPDMNPLTGVKNRHTRNLGRRDVVTKREAMLAFEQLRRELFASHHHLNRPTSPDVEAWTREYLSWHSTQYPASTYRTRQVMEQHILPDWGLKRLDE